MVRRESYNPLLKSYPDSEKINAVSEGAEVLYTRLIAATDDAHRYYGDPDFVLAKLFTARMANQQVTSAEIESRIVELENIGLLRRYQVRGVRYIELIGCFKKFRKDVKPHLIFSEPENESEPVPERTRPEDVTDAGRSRAEDVTLDPASNPASNPPPPERSKVSQDGWVGVVVELETRGVRRAADAVKQARANGCDVELIRSVISHFDANSPAWEPGALFYRVMNLRPEQDIRTLWPEPSRAKRVEAGRQQASKNSANLEKQRQEAEATHRADKARSEKLEQQHGSHLDALDREGVVKLIRQAAPVNPEFMIRQWRRCGLEGSVRAMLLEHVAGNGEPQPAEVAGEDEQSVPDSESEHMTETQLPNFIERNKTMREPVTPKETNPQLCAKDAEVPRRREGMKQAEYAIGKLRKISPNDELRERGYRELLGWVVYELSFDTVQRLLKEIHEEEMELATQTTE